MEQVGKVISVKGELVDLEVKRMSACGTSCDSCHSSCEQKSEYITLPNLVNAKVGDYVEIHSDTSFILISMLKVYGIPLVLFIGAIVIATSQGFTQLFSLLIGILSFIFSFFILRIIDSKSPSTNTIEIKRIL